MRNILVRRGHRVRVNGLTGSIHAIRQDANGVDIFTIRLDDSSATPDGIYVARECELTWL